MIAKDKLHVCCGKWRLVKILVESTVRELNAVSLSEDDLLQSFYPGKVIDVPAYAQHSNLIKEAQRSSIAELLQRRLNTHTSVGSYNF